MSKRTFTTKKTYADKMKAGGRKKAERAKNFAEEKEFADRKVSDGKKFSDRKISDKKFTDKKTDGKKSFKTDLKRTKGFDAKEKTQEEPKAAPKPKSRCSVSKSCGGCTMIDVPMEQQLLKKQQLVEACIGAYGAVDPIIKMKNPGRYRNKVTSIFGLDHKRKPVCGVYRAFSHEIVPVKTCLIQDRRADSIVQTIYELMPSFKFKVYDEITGLGMIRAVQVRTGHATGEIMVTIVTSSAAFPSKANFVKALLEKQPAITTIVQNINDKDTTMILGEREKVLYGPGYIVDELCGKKFRISSRSFYQVNSLQTQKLYNVAIDMAGLSGKERVLDAYCGIGTIGICASDKAKEVISVELNENAVKDAEQNAKDNGVTNVSVYADDAGRFMEDLAEKKFSSDEGERESAAIDVLFMDPPRAGSSEEFMASACFLAPKKIVYISCNPITLGDNLKYLTAHGYKMTKAVPVDMFPYTESVECVVQLVRDGSPMPVVSEDEIGFDADYDGEFGEDELDFGEISFT